MKIFHILTAFPNAFSYLDTSMIKKAKNKKKISVNILDLKEFGHGRWNKIDGRPFGGGPGMLIQIDPVVKAIQYLGYSAEKDVRLKKKEGLKVIMTSPSGIRFTQQYAEKLKELNQIILILCGHYEGFDSRIKEYLVDEEISIGDYVLSGGELPAMIIIDSVSRLIPGVLGNDESAVKETKFHEMYIEPEHPQYTRPSQYILPSGRVAAVPDVLLSGNHAEIEKWRSMAVGFKRQQS